MIRLIATSSLGLEGHMKLALRVFGYLRKFPNRRVVIDSRDPIYLNGDFEASRKLAEEMRDEYPDAAEEIDPYLPEPPVDELTNTSFVDSDHGHDRVTRRSITGLITLVGRTPVCCVSKRQGAVATSTYGAEFAAMCAAIEETTAVRYSLRSLGVRIEHASYVMCDNLGVVQNSTIADSLLKKKHVAVSYHMTREAVAAGTALPIKIHTDDNYSDVMTKSLGRNAFMRHSCGLFY